MTRLVIQLTRYRCNQCGTETTCHGADAPPPMGWGLALDFREGHYCPRCTLHMPVKRLEFDIVRKLTRADQKEQARVVLGIPRYRKGPRRAFPF